MSSDIDSIIEEKSRELANLCIKHKLSVSIVVEDSSGDFNEFVFGESRKLIYASEITKARILHNILNEEK